jgi:hypothetical protein
MFAVEAGLTLISNSEETLDLGTGVKATAGIAGIGFLVEFLPAGIGAFAAHRQ